jgi:hypothetical protein
MAEKGGVEATSASTVVRSVAGDVLVEVPTGKSFGVAVNGVKQISVGSGGLGYATGVGGTVTQITSRTTGVTLSKLCGSIITDASSLAAAGEAKFTVTNTLVAATDVVVCCLKTDSATGTSLAYVSDVADGSFEITITNLHASTADTSASTINFAVIKAVAA